MKKLNVVLVVLVIGGLVTLAAPALSTSSAVKDVGQQKNIVSPDMGKKGTEFDSMINSNSQNLLMQGRQTFRFDTFGDEAFWGDTLQLHKAIEGEANGGVGPGVSPNTALAVGLKVDVDALPQPLIQKLKQGRSISMILPPHLL